MTDKRGNEGTERLDGRRPGRQLRHDQAAGSGIERVVKLSGDEAIRADPPGLFGGPERPDPVADVAVLVRMLARALGSAYAVRVGVVLDAGRLADRTNLVMPVVERERLAGKTRHEDRRGESEQPALCAQQSQHWT